MGPSHDAVVDSFLDREQSVGSPPPVLTSRISMCGSCKGIMSAFCVAMWVRVLAGRGTKANMALTVRKRKNKKNPASVVKMGGACDFKLPSYHDASCVM